MTFVTHCTNMNTDQFSVTTTEPWEETLRCVQREIDGVLTVRGSKNALVVLTPADGVDIR